MQRTYRKHRVLQQWERCNGFTCDSRDRIASTRYAMFSFAFTARQATSDVVYASQWSAVFAFCRSVHQLCSSALFIKSVQAMPTISIAVLPPSDQIVFTCMICVFRNYGATCTNRLPLSGFGFQSCPGPWLPEDEGMSSGHVERNQQSPVKINHLGSCLAVLNVIQQLNPVLPFWIKNLVHN